MLVAFGGVTVCLLFLYPIIPSALLVLVVVVSIDSVVNLWLHVQNEILLR